MYSEVGYGYASASAPEDADADTSTVTRRDSDSVYSYHSSRDALTLFRNIEGRTLNALNDTYMLPADETEFSRQDMQHYCQLTVVGSLYIQPEKVQAVLAPKVDDTTRILDLGTGGGIWATRMAQEFPHAEVVGVDLAPSTSRIIVPNCRFEFDDFMKGLSHYNGHFDVVHARGTGTGITDFPWFISEAAQCLKPGGMLLVTDGNFQLYTSYRQHQPPVWGTRANPGESWMARILLEACKIMRSRGSCVDAARMSATWMQRCPLLTDCGTEAFYIPLGPWEAGQTPDETRRRVSLGNLGRQISMEYVRALRPLFITAGWPPETIDRMIAGTDRELTDLNVHMYMKWHYSWGTRVPCTSNEGTPNPPSVPLPPEDPFSGPNPVFDPVVTEQGQFASWQPMGYTQLSVMPPPVAPQNQFPQHMPNFQNPQAHYGMTTDSYY